MDKQTERIPEAEAAKELSALLRGFPCGILYCTCEKYPRILSTNAWMLDALGITETDEYWTDFVRDNLFFMIPSDQWPQFRHSLELALERESAVGIEHRVKNARNEEVELMGWVRTVTDARGEKGYLFLYTSLTEEKNTRLRKREEAYLSLLGEAYDGVFKIERQNHIVECLSIQEKLNAHMYFVNGMRVVINCMLQKSYYSLVYADDRRRVEEFFRMAVERQGLDGNGVSRMEFRTMGDGILKEYSLLASELNAQTVLLCCRETTEEKSARRRQEEEKQVQAINSRMETGGMEPECHISAYRLLEETVFPQSESSRYLPDRGVGLRHFLEKENISWENYQQAMERGETQLPPGDGTTRQLFITRRSVPDGDQPEYLLLIYTFRTEKSLQTGSGPRVTIRTFGYFDVLVDGKPIVFPHEKSKEMLALMVDRKGSFVGNPYFISCLWEDEPYGEKIQSRCRQTVFRMMETLKRYGIENIVEKVDGHRRIIPEMVNCDYFDYINGKNDAKMKFNGTYMSDYSWGEETLSTLLRSSEINKKQE